MDASRLGFDPLIPWLVLWGLVGVAVVLWGVYVALRGKAWLFRALAMTVLAVALANPQWIQEQREPLKDIVAETTDVIEKMCIETALELTRNNRVAAADLLGLSRQSLYVKLRKFGLINKDGE